MPFVKGGPNPGFKKGQSGNKGGRPKIIAEIAALARQHSSVAIDALVEIVTNKRQNASARVAAANALLDRGYGKAPQTLELEGVDGAPLVPILNITIGKGE